MISLKLIDKRIHYILNKYVDFEVERLTTNIITKTINEELLKYDNENLLLDGKFNSIKNYDILKINLLKNKIVNSIQNELNNLDNGKIDDYFIFERIKKGRFKKIKNGFLCDINIGSIENSIVFANIGPSIPMKIVFSGQINSNVDIDIKEYGINNAIVKIYLIVEIKEQIIMPLTSKRKKILVKQPISIDIVQGNIPNYYYGNN